MACPVSVEASLAEQIKAEAARLGFSLCGITSALPPPHHRRYAQWLAEGRAGEMLYLHRQEPKRGDLTQVLPEAKSVVCVALNYSPENGKANAGTEQEPGTGSAGLLLRESRSATTEKIASIGSSVSETLSFKSRPALPVPVPSWTSGTVARYARVGD
jgi:epoxyqueuosine reductase QueG